MHYCIDRDTVQKKKIPRFSRFFCRDVHNKLEKQQTNKCTSFDNADVGDAHTHAHTLTHSHTHTHTRCACVRACLCIYVCVRAWAGVRGQVGLCVGGWVYVA